MTTDPRSADTRRRLVQATIQVIRTEGIAKISARAIAATGQVNQALVFYHFGSVDGLVAHACREATAERVALYADDFAAVDSFGALARLGARLHAEEREAGNVTVLAQVLAGAHANPALAEAAGQAIALWTEAVRDAVARVLRGSALDGVVDATALADLVSATFVGVELLEPAREGDGSVAGTLARLEELGALLDGLGPVARRAVRSTLRPQRSR